MQLLSTNELNIAAPHSKLDSCSNGNSRNLFLEYESDSESKGEYYETIDGTSYTVLTHGQRLKNQTSSHTQKDGSSPSMSNAHTDQETSTLQMGKDHTSFDFIQFCEESKVQISTIDYLKSHPSELKRLVDRCKGNTSDTNCKVMVEKEDETLTSGLFNQEDSTILATSPGQKLEPLYISLYINRC